MEEMNERLEISVYTENCEERAPEKIGRAPGVLTLFPRKQYGEQTSGSLTLAPTEPPNLCAVVQEAPLRCLDGFGELRNGACACASGRAGVECRLCETAAGCGAEELCDTSMIAVGGSDKNYFCEPIFDESLQPFFMGGQFAAFGDLRVSISVNGATGDALVTAWEKPSGLPRVFECSAQKCAPTDFDGSTVIECETTSCRCLMTPCGEALAGVLQDVENEATFECDAAGHCSLQQNELPLIIRMNCTAGSCLDVNSTMRAFASDISASGDGGDLLLRVLIVGVCLCATLLLCVWLSALAAKKIDVAQDLAGVDPQPAEKGVSLHFTDISYIVKQNFNANGDDDDDDDSNNAKNKRNERRILRNVSGRVEPGEMLAIMGESGAGKTSLLDILANWRKSGIVYGSVTVDGKRRSRVPFKRISAYVPQEELFLPILTVEEQLQFTADLMFGEEIGPLVRSVRIEQALADVGLTHVRNTRIGGRGLRGISGGERKRLSIANQLLGRPRLLFCDEPTSGLDAANALSVMRVLHRLARKKHQTVIVSIHQPRHNIFAMFDRLLLLHRGYVAFSGPAQLAPDYFVALGHRCGRGVNFADHALDVLAAASPQEHANFRANALINDAVHAYTPTASKARGSELRRRRSSKRNRSRGKHRKSKSAASAALKAHLSESKRIVEEPGAADDDDTISAGVLPTGDAFRSAGYATSFLDQTGTLARRSFLQTVRTWRLLATHAFVAVTLGVVVGLIFQQRGKGLSGFQDRVGSLFFTVTLFAFANLSVLDLFLSERHVFVREREAQLYSPLAYYCAKIMVDMPLIRILPPLIYGCIVYPLIEYRSGLLHFGIFQAAMTLNSVTSASMLYLVGTLVPSSGIANLIGSMLLLFFLLFGGFLLNNDTAPGLTVYLLEASFFNHALEALTANELAGAEFVFDPVAIDLVTDIDGQLFLDQLGFSADSLPINFIALGGMTLFYLFFGYLALFFCVRSLK